MRAAIPSPQAPAEGRKTNKKVSPTGSLCLTKSALSEMPFWRGRTFADAVVLSWRSVSGGGRQIAKDY
ncbi:MAG: hypothetical protein QOJ44_2129 [Acidimicrobiaceae bacterium]|nr:hypothetical protein [Acidimicrobiaceae bacterium]